jgi:hypothetical protein
MTADREQETALTTSTKINDVFLGLKVVKRTSRKIFSRHVMAEPKDTF